MAYSGVWGCYIHIPKTGGMWVKKVLGQMGPSYADGSSHGLPEDWTHDRMFCTVRHPAKWLASVWWHRITHKWADYKGHVPWHYFCMLMKEYETKDFPEFVENVTTNLPGLIGWFWGTHIAPPVMVVRLEDAPGYLASIGANPDAIPPQNVGTKVPNLTEEVIDMIWAAEKPTYEKYGYRRWPSGYKNT